MKTRRIMNIIIVSLFTLTMVTIQIQKKLRNERMYNEEIKGVVWDIYTARGGHHYFYNKNNKKDYFIDDDFFDDREGNKIAIGDSVYKPQNSDIVYIYRKNTDSIYILQGKSRDR